MPLHLPLITYASSCSCLFVILVIFTIRNLIVRIFSIHPVFIFLIFPWNKMEIKRSFIVISFINWVIDLHMWRVTISFRLYRLGRRILKRIKVKSCFESLLWRFIGWISLSRDLFINFCVHWLVKNLWITSWFWSRFSIFSFSSSLKFL